jgi:hypothetical protein
MRLLGKVISSPFLIMLHFVVLHFFNIGSYKPPPFFKDV